MYTDDVGTVRAPTSSAAATIVVSVVWLAAVTVSVAWVSGLVSADDSLVDPDYLWRPLSIGAGAELALGLIATATTAGLGWVLLRSYANGTMSNTRRALLFPAAGIAAYAGLTYGAATAPTIGANIGGGLMLLGAVPFVAAMAIVAGVQLRKGRRLSPS